MTFKFDSHIFATRLQNIFMIQRLYNSDSLGIIGSSLCMIHCLATPFLFMAKTCSDTCCVDSPLAWRLIDVAFLIIALYAVVSAYKNAKYLWVKLALSMAWLGLAFIIVNSYLSIVEIPEQWIYLPAISLVVLHIYNLNNCKCSAKCCG